MVGSYDVNLCYDKVINEYIIVLLSPILLGGGGFTPWNIANPNEEIVSLPMESELGSKVYLCISFSLSIVIHIFENQKSLKYFFKEQN